MLQQQPPQYQMPSQAYANYAMGPLQVSFSFRVEPPNDFLCHLLVSVMVFAFYSKVPMWLPCLPMGAQLLGFTLLLPVPQADKMSASKLIYYFLSSAYG